MTTNQRGCVYLLGFLVFAFFACILIPFILLPQWQQAVTLPVIAVPAEPYLKGWPSADFQLVNSLGGAVLAMVIVFAIALIARRHSNGWTKQVPGRFQALVEMIVDGLWGLTKQQAGNKPIVRNLLFPLVASLFLFLLAGNWGKLLPGVETVGVLHCAIYEPSPISGFPVMETKFLGGPSYFIVKSPAPLNTGIKADYDSYHVCEAVLGVTKYIKQGYLPTQLDPYLDQEVKYTVQEGDTLNSIVAKYNDEVTAKTSAEIVQPSSYISIPYEGWAPLEFSVASIASQNLAEDGTSTIQFVASADDHSEESTGESHGKLPAQIEGTPEATPEGEATEAAGTTTEESHSETGTTSESHSETGTTTEAHSETVVLDGDAALIAGQSITIRKQLLGGEATTVHNQLYMVTPFVRGMTTDLSFTIGLSLLAFVAIQFFGLYELGPSYLLKFINIHAIGNIAKKPLGVIDFVVGLFEIISEFGKIISLSFRLFGAIFAGTVLFAVIMFLTGTTTPAIILLLEFIVGFSQAAVFAILTLIFSSQAMVSHIHDEEHGDHAEHAH
jgi:F0F1-type ATP synthase membrane subunit a